MIDSEWSWSSQEIDINACTLWEFTGFVDRVVVTILYEEACGNRRLPFDTHAPRPYDWPGPLERPLAPDSGDV